MKCLILFHSVYGHVHRMAEAVATGVREVPGAEAVLRKAPETGLHGLRWRNRVAEVI